MNENFNQYDNYATAQAFDQEAKVHKVLSFTYLYMVLALAVSAIAALWVIQGDFALTNTSFIVLAVAEIVVVIAANVALSKNNAVLGGILFFAYAVINGMTLSVIAYVYTLASIFSIFLMCAALFGAMSLYGFVTKRDLSAIGRIGMMSLFAVIILGVMNIFFKSSGLDFLLAVVGLAVFIGLTAYDTQMIKERARFAANASVSSLALMGALQLYLDFINMFLKLLRLFGKAND